MTRVWYDEEHLMIKVMGHAGYGPVGSDIVCAAASTLCATLEQALADESYRTYVKWDELSNTYRAECYPEVYARERCETVFSTIIGGFLLLAAEFPHHLRVERKDLAFYTE